MAREKMKYSDVKDEQKNKNMRGIVRGIMVYEIVILCVLCLLIGIILGAVVAKAQTIETHDAMPIKTAAQPPSAAYSSDYPDKSLTPGVTRTVTLKELCTPGSTKDARHVTAATKKAVFTRYGFQDGKYKAGDWEIDHFISLENGGANDVMNLWPQHYCAVGNDPAKTGCYGAREKDRVETQLHRWVCQGKMTLHDDQVIIQTDWVACYKTITSGGICAP